jgi:hypothetical protein
MDKPLHYEIHVTVKTEEVNKFIEECGVVGVKPIVLDLQKQDGGSIQDVMTSSKVTGNDETAWQHMYDVSWHLQSKGFDVVREKIETVPWHPKAAVHDENSKTGYFEAHFPILVAPVFLNDLKIMAKNYGLHMSKNPLKVRSDGGIIQMLTLRKNMSIDYFKNWYEAALNWIDGPKFHIIEIPETEYALYDSNVDHDAEWVHSKSVA